MKCIIYKITNILNKKVYIGQTWNVDLKKYFTNSHIHHKGRPKLFNAIRKYGKSNFTIEKLLSVQTQIEADRIECEMILKHNSINRGYNIQLGGHGGKHSNETKVKISNACKGKKISEIIKNKISKARLGMKFSEDTKNKMSVSKIGRHVNTNSEFKKGHQLNRKYSVDKEQEITAIYLQIRSCHKVAAIFECSPCTVLNIVKRSGNKTDSTIEAEKSK